MLREIYHALYRQIVSRIDPSIPGAVVGLGSSIGRLEEVITQCVTTDLFPNPWLDRNENCAQLSFADGSVSHLILFEPAAQGSATRPFWWGEGHDRLHGWRRREQRSLTAFDYFASGGFSGPQLGGRFLLGLMRSLDFLAALFPQAFASRRLVVLEKGKS